MISRTLGEITARCGGALSGVGPEVAVVGLVADSRAVQPGELFVAIEGARSDGHDFAEQALESGAVAVLSARPLVGGDGSDLPCVVVDDPVVALGRLAAAERSLLACKVIAVTGSSGKTSTKDLLAAVFASAGTTVAARGSFNTDVGVPLTILRADEHTEYLILEMGMRGEGHIAYLAEIAKPDVGVVINVGSAHVGVVGSVDAIARAKGELVAALDVDGVAVLNGDDPRVRAMGAITPAHVVLFGETESSNVRAVDVRLDVGARASFTLLDRRDGRDEAAEVDLRVVGEHQVSNALAAAAAGLSLGLPLDAVAEALSAADPISPWRMEVRVSSAGITVINDAFNANPDSMRAALRSLAAMADGRRTWAVLGEMGELGDSAMDEHDAIGRLAVRLDISRLLCVGPATRVMFLAASNEGSWGDESKHVPDIDAAIALLHEELRPGDVVLVKASRSVGLESVAADLLEWSPA